MCVCSECVLLHPIRIAPAAHYALHSHCTCPAWSRRGEAWHGSCFICISNEIAKFVLQLQQLSLIMRCNYDACLPQGGSNELQAALQASQPGRLWLQSRVSTATLQRCQQAKKYVDNPVQQLQQGCNCNNNEINKLQLLGRATSQPVSQFASQPTKAFSQPHLVPRTDIRIDTHSSRSPQCTARSWCRRRTGDAL